MTSDEAVEIFKAATTSYHKINSKTTFVDISNFGEKANAMLV